MIRKHLLNPDRVRRPPREGWSWVDRRFLRHYASGLSRDEILLYLFLAAVSDKHGLSFYADATIALRLRLDEAAVVRARQQLVDQDLVCYHAPLTQVLSLPPPAPAKRRGRPVALGEIFQALATQRQTDQTRRSS